MGGPLEKEGFIILQKKRLKATVSTKQTKIQSDFWVWDIDWTMAKSQYLNQIVQSLHVSVKISGQEKQIEFVFALTYSDQDCRLI